MSLCNGCTTCCYVIGIAGNRGDKQIKELQRSNSIPPGWNKVSKRQAIKINPVMKSRPSNTMFFTCSHLTESGCGVYEERPRVCSGYPYYDKTYEQFLDMYSSFDYEAMEFGKCNLIDTMLKIPNEEEYKVFTEEEFSRYLEDIPPLG